MRVGKARAGLGGFYSGHLRGQHQVIQRALRAGKCAVGREGAGDVGGVAVQLATCVNQHQLTIPHRGRVGTVVQHAGVGTGGHDGAVGRVLRALQAELMQQLSVQVVFAHVFAFAQHAGRQLHGADVGLRADLRGAAHHVLFIGILDQTHFVQRTAQVAHLLGHQGAKAHAGAQAAEPAVDAGLQALVGGKGVPDGIGAIEQAGQALVQLVHRIGGVHSEGARRCIRPEAKAVPDFALQVFGLAKQGGGAVTLDDEPSPRLGKAAKVMEVAVMTEQKVRIPVALLLRGRGQHRHAMRADVGGQARAAAGVVCGECGGGGLGHGVCALSSARRSGVPTSVQRPV